MAIGGQNTPGNLVGPACQLTWNATDKRVYIVRIVGNLKLGAAPTGTDERDLAQLRDDLLAEDKEISKYADRKKLEKLVDPANYLGVAGEMVDRVLKMRK